MKNHRIFSGHGRLMGAGVLMLLLSTTSAGLSLAQQPPLPPDLKQQDITLETAIEMARQFNPALLGFLGAEQQAQAQAEQAGRGPNPDLDFEVENFGGSGSHSGFSAAEYTLALSQTFELGGKRQGEKEVADWAVKELSHEEVIAGLEVENEVVDAFIDALKARHEIDLALKLVRLAEENFEFVRRRVAMGAVSSVEETQALVDVHSARLELETARQTREIARIRLASLWNSTTPTYGDVVGSLESMCELPAWDDLQGRMPNSPTLKWWDIEEGKRRSEIMLADALGSMDLTASAGLRHYQDSGEFAAVAAISIPLQFRDKNDDAHRAAQYNLDQLDSQRQTQVLVLRAALLEQYQTVSTAHGHIVFIRDEILPSAEEAMQQSEEAYRKGRFTMTNLLAVRRTWFEWQQNYVAALVDYQSGIAQIHQLLGDSHTEILISQENHSHD